VCSSDLIVFLGDLEPSRPLRQEYAPFQAADIECWHIHGNHDTDRLDTWRNLEDGAEHCLEGRVIDIAGLRVAGLGGIFRGEVWYPQQGSEAPVYRSYGDYARAIRRQAGLKARLSPQDLVRLQDTPRPDPDLLDASRCGKLLKHRSTIFPETVERLAKLEADILVTHEAPAGHPYGFGALDELARAMRVRVLVHGHHHVEHRYEADEKGTFVTIPVGYCGIKDETGSVILEAR
jgi:predicted phosphodiesterase